jgi:uncharacterized protein YjbJ (UPF0337 family)
MIRAELFKEQWVHVSPKIRDLFPKLTEQDLGEINGNMDALVAKVNEKYGLKREDILNQIAPLLAVPAERPGATKIK